MSKKTEYISSQGAKQSRFKYHLPMNEVYTHVAPNKQSKYEIIIDLFSKIQRYFKKLLENGIKKNLFWPKKLRNA